MTGYLMLQTPASFTPLMAPQQDAAPLSFVFHGTRLLVREADLGLPDEAAVRSLALDPQRLQAVGVLDGQYCQAAWLDDDRVLYGLGGEVGGVNADGTGKPARYLTEADSPAVVRP